MTGPTLLALAPAILLSCLAVVELFFRLPFMARVEAVNAGALRALGVVRSPRISDHWKEKVLPSYAGRILRASLGLGGLLLLCAGAFLLVWTLSAWWPAGGWRGALAALERMDVQLWLLAVGVAWAVLRARMGRSGTPQSDYSPASQMLHRLALGSEGMRTLCDDLDRRIARRRVARISVDRPVYVTALARAGTTVLLEALYGSGRFASLTYRAMPFVMAPYAWGALSRPHAPDPAQMKERAHGDRMKVGVDSPEAFEEVFWETWAPRSVRDPEGLRPWGEPEAALLERYRDWVRRILARDAAGRGSVPGRRYLSKNNNNLLRIPWLLAAFPDARIITPFRDPAAHVQSLMRQHRRFLERHGEDPFSLEYMDWLGHHEFGRHFLPFKVGGTVVPGSPEALLEPDWWMDYWSAVYAFLLERHGDQLVWFDYDRFCREPESVLGELEQRLELESGNLTAFSARVSAPPHTPDAAIQGAVNGQARDVHAALVARAASGVD